MYKPQIKVFYCFLIKMLKCKEGMVTRQIERHSSRCFDVRGECVRKEMERGEAVEPVTVFGYFTGTHYWFQ